MLVIQNIERIKDKIVKLQPDIWTVAKVQSVNLLEGQYYQFDIQSNTDSRIVHIWLNRETKGEKRKEQTYYHFEGGGEYYELITNWDESVVRINREFLSPEGLLMFIRNEFETIKTK